MPDDVDVDRDPHATGLAAETVARHQEKNSLVFHAGWFCPFVQRVWIALEERQIPYEYREVNPYRKEPHFLAVNPKGLVPALEHDGKALYESLVLLEYLDDAFPSSSKSSKGSFMSSTNDPHEKGIQRLASQHFSNQVVPKFYKLLQSQSEEERRQAKDEFVEAFKGMHDQWFVKGGEGGSSEYQWSRGSEFSTLDAVIAPWIVRFPILIKHRSFKVSDLGPELQAYSKRIMERPSVKNTTSEEENYERVYERYLSNTAESEVAKATRKGEWLK